MSTDVVTRHFRSVPVPGRFEVVGREPLIVLDGAHSPEAAASVAATLHDDFERGGQTILVVGMLQPRDPTPVLEALEVDTAAAVIACAPPSPRAIAPEGDRRRGGSLGSTGDRRARCREGRRTRQGARRARRRHPGHGFVVRGGRGTVCFSVRRMNRTFVMAKPDAVERGLIGEIVARLERKGLRIVAAEGAASTRTSRPRTTPSTSASRSTAS